jgi:hypothetical protein
VGSSKTCSRSRRRHGRVAAAAGNRREAWRLGATAARRGEAGRGPARGGERRHGCWGGTWPVRAAGVGHKENRERGLEVEEGGLICYFPKVQGLHCKA